MKRSLQHRFFAVNFLKCLNKFILYFVYFKWTGCSETSVCLFKNTLFYRTSPVAASDSFRFPAWNFIKNETPAKTFLSKFCKIYKTIFWQNVSGWLLLVFICESWEVFQITSIIVHLWKLLNSSTSCRTSTTRFNRKYFTSSFQAFDTKTRRSY